MASFFRKRIAQKVISLLQRRYEIVIPNSPDLISCKIKINKNKTSEPELVLPWKRIEYVCNSPNISTSSISPKEFVRLLRNQGLPTAEGFIDIKLSESALSVVFTVDKHIFSKIILLDICTNSENLSKSSCLFEEIKKQNVVVQSSLPNIGNLCHLSHFYTAIYSQFVTNINKFAGHNVMNIAMMNDWGINAAICLTGYQQFKFDEACTESVFNLFQIMKASILQYKNNSSFREKAENNYSKLLKGDLKCISEWEQLKNTCLNYYHSLYEKIGVKYDAVLFDSCLYKESEAVAAKLIEQNILGKDDKIKYESESHPNSTAGEDSNSTLINLSRYIAAAVELKKISNFDSLDYIVPSTQKEFCSLLLVMLKKLNYLWADNIQQIDLPFQDFKSRRIQKESIENILNEVKEEMIRHLHNNLQMELNDSLEEMAEDLSLTSLIVHYMRFRRKVNYKYDLEEIASFTRNTGASFQLCYAGLKGLQGDSKWEVKTDIDTSPLLEPKAQNLIRHLARFDEMVFKSYTLLEPCILYQYLSSLWYFTDQASDVLKLDKKHNKKIVIQARLLLLSATLKILGQGLNLLGIIPLNKVYTPEKPVVDEKMSSSSSNKIDF